MSEKRFRRAYVATELHLEITPDGVVYTPNRAAEYNQFARYLCIADEVVVVARVQKVDLASSNLLVAGQGVSVAPVPYYRGLRSLLRSALPLLAYFSRLNGGSSVSIGRLPEVLSIGLFVASYLKRLPYIAFVVADAGAIGTALARQLGVPAIDRLFPFFIRFAIRRSIASIYVTQHWLQERFPPPKGRPTLERSNVVLDGPSYRAVRDYSFTETVPVLISVGTMGSSLKGQDFLIEIVAALRRRGIMTRLMLLGDGPHQESLRARAHEKCVSDQVQFVGNVPDVTTMRALLDSADLFVFGSRMEGLPRAVIEAMARSLPVITTNAGGVSELVDPEFVVPIDDTESFIDRCIHMFSSPEIRRGQGTRNFAVATAIGETTDEVRLRRFLHNVVDH